jgi:hypothetical protein
MVATGSSRCGSWLFTRFDRPEAVVDVLERGRREVVTFFPGTDWQALEDGHLRQ